MSRQGKQVSNGRVSVSSLRTRMGAGYPISKKPRLNLPAVVFLAVTLLCAHSWGQCTTSSHGICSPYSSGPLCREWNIAGGYHVSNNVCHFGCTYASGSITCEGSCRGSNDADARAMCEGYYCELHPTAEGCVVESDTTWTCTSVFSENNVIRSYVQESFASCSAL